MRAARVCRPVGARRRLFLIQGLRAAHLPLATFWSRLRRYERAWRRYYAPGAAQFESAFGALF